MIASSNCAAACCALLGGQTAPTTLLLEYKLFYIPRYTAFTQKSVVHLLKRNLIILCQVPGIVFPCQASGLSSYMAVPTTQGFRAREKNWISFNKTVFATAVHRDSITQILIQTGRKKSSRQLSPLKYQRHADRPGTLSVKIAMGMWSSLTL